jgi:hypothetical protein
MALRDAKSIVLQSAHSDKLIKCQIIAAKQNKLRVEKYLTFGWYNFIRKNNLQTGNSLIFKHPQQHTAMHVQIVTMFKLTQVVFILG